MLKGGMTAGRNALALALLRISVGVFFLIFAEYKVAAPTFVEVNFANWIQRFLAQGVYPFMRPVLEQVVLPHARAFALLVAYGELAIGMSLVLGLLSRAASAGGLAFMLALLFSSDYPGPHARLWQFFGASLDHSVLALCFAAFLIGQPEAALSVRNWMDRRKAAA